MNRRIWHLGLIGFHPEYWHVHDELLDAKVGEVTIERILQHFDRTFGDDSASCGFARDGTGVAKLRSQARTEISCGDSCRCIAGIALASLGTTHSIFPTVVLLSFAALGIYSV